MPRTPSKTRIAVFLALFLAVATAAAVANPGIPAILESVTALMGPTAPESTTPAVVVAAPGTCDGGNNVDVESTGGTALAGYPTVKAAFDAINSGTHTGTIIIEICASTTEGATPATLNGNGQGLASYGSVNLYPIADGISVSGNPISGFGVIQLKGADNVIIDGDNPNSGGINRNLTINNTTIATVIANSVVRIATVAAQAPSADNITIKNANLSGNVTGGNAVAITSTTGSSNSSFGIYVGGNGGANATDAPTAITSVTAQIIPAATTVNNLVINNNVINQTARGIVFNGASVTNSNGLTISNNVIGNATPGGATGVYSMGMTVQGSSLVNVSDNTVYVESFVQTGLRAIDVGSISVNVSGVTIQRNRVVRVLNNSPQSFGAYGINLNGGNNHIVQNNFVVNVRNDQTAGTGAFSTTFGAFGIRIAAGTGHKVLHNSVHLFGAMPGSTNSNLTAAFGIVATGQTGMDVRNNIFSNQLTGGNPGSPGTRHAAVYLPSGGTIGMNLNWNNNDYFQGAGPLSRMAQVGATFGTGEYVAANFDPTSTTPVTNFRAYSVNLHGAGNNDNASQKVDPLFVSNTDLHLQAGSPMQSQGANAGVTTDIDGDARGATPDIGADEFVAGAPEMNVTGNGVSIADGDATPSLADHTDFGPSPVAGGQFVRTFVIENTGAATLNLGPVINSGPHGGDYVVTSPPAASVPPLGSTQFDVTFDPSAAGVRSATLSIANDDTDEDPYDFAIQGTGVGPTITVDDIGFNDDFGNVTVGLYSATRTYHVSGTNMTDNISIAVPGGFQIKRSTDTAWVSGLVLNQSGGSVPNTAIDVRFHPTSPGGYGGFLAHSSVGATAQGLPISGNGVAAPCTPAPSGMVAWYAAENNALDKRGPTFENGTLQNGVAFVTGEVGRAFSFDGVDDYVEAPDSAAFDATTELTIDAWFFPTEAKGHRVITKWGTDGFRSYNIDLNSNGSISFYTSGDGSGFPSVTTPAGAVPVNQWTHVGATYQGSTFQRIYINGVESASITGGAVPPSLFNSSSTFRLGRNFNDAPGGTNYNGLLDEVEVFNRALNGTEIAAIYSAGSAGKCDVCTPPPPDMISWWKANGNAGDAIGANHGTLQNGATFAPGKVGQAFSLDGVDDRVDIPHNANQNISGAFSADAWIFPETLPNAGPRILDKDSNLGTRWLMAVNNFGPNVNSVSVAINAAAAVTPNNSITLNTWNHVAFTYDGVDVLKIYINGIESASANIGIQSTTGVTNPLRIGDDNFVNTPGDGNDREFDGLIDEVELFNRALTATEISDIANAGSAGKCDVCTAPPTGMLAWYAAENNALDHQGPTFENGTLQNGVTFAPGKVGQAFSFDGVDDHVNVADSASLDIAGTVSIDFWAKRQRDAIDPVLEKGGDWTLGQTNYGVGFHTSANGSPLYFYWAGGGKGVAAPTDGLWHHYAIVATHGQTDPKFYIDGVENTTISFTFGSPTINLVTNNLPLHIGAQVDGSFNVFGQNLVDELEIFDRALTPSEIAGIYNAGSAGKCDGCTPAPANMTHWWEANGNAGDSVGTSDAILQNGATFAPGKVGQAFSFDGVNDRVVVPHAATNNITGAFSADAWILPESFTNPYPRVLEKNDFIATRWSFTLANDGVFNNTIGFVMNAGPAVYAPSNTIQLGQWNHVAFTYDGVNVLRIYVNGVEVISGNIGQQSTPLTTPMIIGNDDFVDVVPADNRSFDGLIDEVELFNRTLSPGEIQNIYNAGSAGKCDVCTAPPPGMVLWHKAEGNANDISGSGNNGTPDAGVTYAAGKVAQAYRFNGTNSVVVPDSTSLDVTTEFTFDAWINPATLLQTGAGVISKVGGGAGNNGYQFGITANNAEVFCQFNAAGEPWPFNQLIATVPGGIPATSWSHIACTYNNANITAYFNGSPIGSVAIGPKTVINSASTLRISGDDNQNLNVFFNGLIDEAEVFNRALSAGEIADIYNAGSAGKCLPPTAAGATLSGRITTANGQGISKAKVTVVGGTLIAPRTVLTGAFGYYSFEDLPAGQTYIVTVGSRRFTFAIPSRVVSLAGDVTDADFVAEP